MQMTTDKHLRKIASVWLEPIDLELADLMDKSERMTIGAFIREVEAVINRVPRLFDDLNIQHLSDDLEDKMAEAMIRKLAARA
jgi:hypothetical protein